MIDLDEHGGVASYRNNYCASVLARDATTGALIWAYNVTPQDQWDLDEIGADWTVVQDYLDELDAWCGRMRAAAAEGGGPPRVGMQERPCTVRAVATARAILNSEGAHEKGIEAAEFLIDHA